MMLVLEYWPAELGSSGNIVVDKSYLPKVIRLDDVNKIWEDSTGTLRILSNDKYTIHVYFPGAWRIVTAWDAPDS